MNDTNFSKYLLLVNGVLNSGFFGLSFPFSFFFLEALSFYVLHIVCLNTDLRFHYI